MSRADFGAVSLTLSLFSLCVQRRYSLEANTIDHTCNCCQEVKTSKRQVTLICPDGSTQDYSYIHVEECDCVSSQCGLQATPTPGQQQEEEQEQDEQQQQQQGQD